MFELTQLLKALAIRSWEYNTYRGRWDDMPSSSLLCVILGAISFVVCAAAMYVEYGLAGAVALPALWLSSLWMFTSEGGAWFNFNKRLLSAIFLATTPAMTLMIFAGQGNLVLEIVVGIHLGLVAVMLKSKE